MKQAPYVVLGLCAAAFWLRADGALGGGGAILGLMAGLVVLVVAVALVAAQRLLNGWRLVLASPLAIAAITWLTLFALRPLELFYYPAETITPLLQLGYDTGDLSRTAAIAGIGCAAWAVGFLAVLTRLGGRSRPLPVIESLQMRQRAPWVLIAVGSLLAGALFMRQGGFSALIHSPGTLHTNQGSGFYGQLGIWMLEGVALYSFAVVLQRPAAMTGAKRVLAVSGPIAILSTLALGSRGLVVFGLLAAAVIYLRLRAPSTRAVAITLVAAVLIGGFLEFAAIVRTNASSSDLGTAVGRSLETPVTFFQTADLSAFDDFVAMQEVVPSSISRLDGSSLIQIPAALTPRALWPGKPQPLDNLVTAYLYPGATAGTPITMQGELYWNFGLLGVAVGALLIGGLMAWSMALLFRRDILSLMLYVVLYASVFALLTRALGTMTANTTIALVGVAIATIAIRPAAMPTLSHPARSLRRLFEPSGLGPGEPG